MSLVSSLNSMLYNDEIILYARPAISEHVLRITSQGQTHNLKVAGSNPAPATKNPRYLSKIAGISI